MAQPKLGAFRLRICHWFRYPIRNECHTAQLKGQTSILLLYFDLRPGQKCHSRWCTGRRWHILMAVMRGNRVGGNWLMKWDEVKKSPWYTHRLMHQKRVTYELHDSYFRLMTIKLAIPKIELATKWTLYYYITQSRQKRRQWQLEIGGSYRKPHQAEGALGLWWVGVLWSCW